MIYRKGQIWIRNGKKREIVRVEIGGSEIKETDGGTWFIVWKTPGCKERRPTWCSTWLEWANKAALFETT